MDPESAQHADADQVRKGARLQIQERRPGLRVALRHQSAGKYHGVGPGFLMERFGVSPKGAPSQPGQRRQSVEATGEIRESAGPNSLALLIRTDCPGGRAR